MILSLTSCSFGNPNNEFFKLIESNFSLKDYELQESISVKDIKTATSSNNTDVKKNTQILLNGNTRDGQGDYYDLYYQDKDMQGKKVTSFTIDSQSKKIYLDIDTLKSFLSTGSAYQNSELSKFIEKSFDNKKNIEIDYSDTSKENLSFINTYNCFKEFIQNKNLISKKDDRYILSIKGKDLSTLLKTLEPYFKKDLNNMYDSLPSLKNSSIAENKTQWTNEINDFVNVFINKLSNIDFSNYLVNMWVNKTSQDIEITTDDSFIQIFRVCEYNNKTNINTNISDAYNIENLDFNKIFSFETISDNSNSSDTYSKSSIKDKNNVKTTLDSDNYTKIDSSSNETDTSIVGKIKKTAIDNGYSNLSVVKALTKSKIYASRTSKSNKIDYVNDEVEFDIMNNAILDMELINSYSLDDFRVSGNGLLKNTVNEASAFLNSNYSLDKLKIEQGQLINGFGESFFEENKFWKFTYNINISNDIVTLNLKATNKTS